MPANNIQLSDVQAVYSGPEWALWELLMGEQIHVGGLQSSMALAEAADVGPGMTGVDLCCCTGAGMRFLVRLRNVDRMHGVDATETVVEKGRARCEAMGLGGRIDFTLADACATGLESGCADFVWGEDAWCYVIDKPALIAEAARLVKPGGTIAFTDWLEGPNGMSDPEMDRLLRFMKFPDIQTLAGYTDLLTGAGCGVVQAGETGRFAPCVDLYLQMVERQLTYDALRILGFDADALGAIGEEMRFMQQLAHQGKIIQGRIVARRSD
ncbi:MAG: methyltransferase domain-containing protein [Thermoguttaceae bacterium]|jgi:SAM-dependent methyltransferase|nr:methyltransferase domain-containing protein [Thermoguttaceae bacterium]